MLGVSRQVDWRFHVALVLAHETGHRIGAIRQLRWSDIDFEGREVRWRAEHEKTGYEHITPMTDEAVAVLEEAREAHPERGETPVLPAPQDPSARHQPREGVHLVAQGRAACRTGAPARKRLALAATEVASDLMDLPLKVLCELGGWKEAQTVLRCYQQADAVQLRKALDSRPRVRV